MTLKYLGNKIGGWIKYEKLRLTYYFYYVQAVFDDKILARIITNVKA